MEKKVKRDDIKKILRVFIFALLLYTFYQLGIPLYSIVILGVFIFLLMFLKGKIYRKIDSFMTKKFLFVSKLNPFARRVLIIIVFIVIYMILKQFIFIILKLAGVDIQKMISESINQSMQ
jgi:hypothetical protein